MAFAKTGYGNNRSCARTLAQGIINPYSGKEGGQYDHDTGGRRIGIRKAHAGRYENIRNDLSQGAD